MKISSAYLIATGSSQGYANNELDDYQDMDDWDLTGDVTQSYADGMNTLSFANAGGSGATGGYGNYETPEGETYHYYVDGNGYGGGGWRCKMYSNHKFCFTNYGGTYKRVIDGHTYYFPIGTVNVDDTDYVGKVSMRDPYQGYYGILGAFYPSSKNIFTNVYVGFYNDARPTFGVEFGCDPDRFPDVPIIDTLDGMAAFLTSPDPFNGKASLTVQTEVGKTYEFRFMGCTSTGFTSEGGEIKIEAGGTPILADFGNTASNVPVLHSVEFTAEGSSATISFDLTKMVQANGVTVKIGDLALYEVTR